MSALLQTWLGRIKRDFARLLPGGIAVQHVGGGSWKFHVLHGNLRVVGHYGEC